jgi:hypothetical protein
LHIFSRDFEFEEGCFALISISICPLDGVDLMASHEGQREFLKLKPAPRSLRERFRLLVRMTAVPHIITPNAGSE